MKKSLLIAAAAIVLTAASCEKSPANNPYKSLELTTKSVGYVQQGNNFAINFIDKVNASTDDDYIMSPLSMQFLLGMILNGAQYDTADEICNVLGYGKGETESVNEFCQSMLKQLPNLDKKTSLTIANSIFVDDGWPLKKPFVDDVSRYYYAKVENLDFSDITGSTQKINKWCKDNTGGLIPKILESVEPDMLAYLLNALYFKSEWKEKFDKSKTKEETFVREDGVKSQKSMMKCNKSFAYTDNDVFQAVRLPYGNSAFSMTILLPTAGNNVVDIVAALKKQGDWQALLREMVICDVDLWLPKFETKFSINLNKILSAMGMPRSFDPDKADFKAMSQYALYLSFIKQDAIIKVDEVGTEAAAVSIGGMKKDMAPAPGDHVVFHADHPFIYIISESSTDAILFAGRYGAQPQE